MSETKFSQIATALRCFADHIDRGDDVLRMFDGSAAVERIERQVEQHRAKQPDGKIPGVAETMDALIADLRSLPLDRRSGDFDRAMFLIGQARDKFIEGVALLNPCDES